MEAFLLLVGPVAIVVTKVVDVVRNAADANDTAPKVVWNVLALALGVGYALLLSSSHRERAEHVEVYRGHDRPSRSDCHGPRHRRDGVRWQVNFTDVVGVA